MTSTERMLLSGLRRNQEAFATTGSFKLSDESGVLGSFVGVVAEDTNSISVVAGGELNERTLMVDADKEQFSDVGVTPDLGMIITYQGIRYAIVKMPNSSASAYSYRFECERQMNSRKK